ncbi:MAG: hypothetical protein WDN06_17265 [Asticcacaulis sp.]
MPATCAFPPRRFLTFEDTLTADQDRQFTQWFHFHPHFNVRQDGCDIVARDNFGAYRLVVEPGTPVPAGSRRRSAAPPRLARAARRRDRAALGRPASSSPAATSGSAPP